MALVWCKATETSETDIKGTNHAVINLCQQWHLQKGIYIHTWHLYKNNTTCKLFSNTCDLNVCIMHTSPLYRHCFDTETTECEGRVRAWSVTAEEESSGTREAAQPRYKETQTLIYSINCSYIDTVHIAVCVYECMDDIIRSTSSSNRHCYHFLL